MASPAIHQQVEHPLIPGIAGIIARCRSCTELAQCGQAIADFFASIGCSLLFFSVFHRDDSLAPVHVFADVPDEILDMCTGFQDEGGCPLAKEAIRLLAPFDAIHHDFSGYDDSLSRRYLERFQALGFVEILTIPAAVGDGVAFFAIGFRDHPSASRLRDAVITLSYQLMINVAARFPEVARFFSAKKLTYRETEILLLTSAGLVEPRIAEVLAISPNTVRAHVENAKRKLGARTKAHAVALAIDAGEMPRLELAVAPSHDPA